MTDLSRLKPAALNAIASATKSRAQNLLTSANGANGVDAKTDAKLKKISQDFESVFLEGTFDRMFSGLGEEGPLGASETDGGNVWRSMLSGEYAKGITRSGGIGMSNDIYRELVRLQAGSASSGKGVQ